MNYTIEANSHVPINLAPATQHEEVLQNVRMILSTIRGTCPLFRDFGTNMDFVDVPIQAAESMLVGEVFDAIARFEPRAEINNISIRRDDMNGKLIPILEVNINE